jgi:transcriptional regulator with XRE-family HTH domain
MSSGFGTVLRSLRERGGHSRRELGEASGLAEGTIRDYELGKRSPSFEAVCRLTVALGAKLTVFAPTADTTGAYRLPERSQRVPYSLILFGRHKGQRLNELPGDYLEWLLQERPRQLQPGQLEEASRVLEERGRGRSEADQREQRRPRNKGERMQRAAAAQATADDEHHRQEVRDRAAAADDPVLARALAERLSRPAPAVPDPEFFAAPRGGQEKSAK